MQREVMMTDRIFVGGGGQDYGIGQSLLLKYGNRHGLIAGATGTGKTVTLQILAESFSAMGVPQLRHRSAAYWHSVGTARGKDCRAAVAALG